MVTPLSKLKDASTMEFDKISPTFFETSKNIAVDLTLYKVSNRKPNRFYCIPLILKEIRAKDLAAAEWHKATETSKNVREHWNVVRNETGNPITSPDKVMKMWSEFYTALSRDSTGNSRSPDRWIEVLGNKKDNPLDINHDISWDEVRMVLMSLALHKAPGGDGLEVGWKAYDTVPIEALLRKLYLCGVEGRTYEFFVAYYKSPEAGVRIGTLMSPLFKVDKGVRQGYPMSPMLFNIFINDILDKVNENIVLVPGNSVKIPGLLFADDLVLLADSEVGIRENLLVVEKWASDNEMSFGISKCDALAVGGSFEHPDILELQEQRVPIVKKYWYLGDLINDDLDLI
ncbi:Retrovirus-related Pol polyprotein from type-1 retrotransposable element R2 [Smittium culicis]|uniref:Retrovirus-related Pol polyprotein from type-1 retrotransposable element R2 n=1 Tax=Smittium culicis TaxID=133412 RepID=A0A1R1X2B5_9FUNG|nr:Retrovirus-related Pol polyprotein from type-1 retrotransposable element R2 [Smittium culicis]